MARRLPMRVCNWCGGVKPAHGSWSRVWVTVLEEELRLFVCSSECLDTLCRMLLGVPDALVESDDFGSSLPRWGVVNG